MGLGKHPKGFGKHSQWVWGGIPMALGKHTFKQKRFGCQASEVLMIRIASVPHSPPGRNHAG